MCTNTQDFDLDFDAMERESIRSYRRKEHRNKKWTTNDKSDYGYLVYNRVIVGNMTNARARVLNAWKNDLPEINHCHHDWDCCGCLYSIRKSWEYSHNYKEITLTITYSYNV
jgi:hypothetical protein